VWHHAHRVERWAASRVALAIAVAALAIDSWSSTATAETCVAKSSFGFDDPERQRVNVQKLLELTQWLRDNPIPVLSLTVSRNGKVVYELYTSRVDRSAAHYVMSVTKSVTAALVGVAQDRKLIKAPDSSVADNLPAAVFATPQSLNRFKTVSVKDVLGMSALDAPLTPHVKTPEAKARSDKFFDSANRLKFALEQATLPRVGKDFQYTDVTPIIAAGIVQLATNKTLLDFGREVLFGPMGFENEEWMHQDGAGYDNASYGLRLRPIDMQKFGILFLNNGCWSGRQLISRSWVATSFKPWIKSNSNNREVNYGWYWWTDWFSSGWVGHTANGWKGQRITAVPDKGVVVTMTGIVEDGTESTIYRDLFNRFIIPAIEMKPSPSMSMAEQKLRLATALKDISANKTAFGPTTESRMLPSVARKGTHKGFLRSH